MPELEPSAVADVIAIWAEQTSDLSGKDFIHNVQVFENKGALMGCSNPHPHSQIWAQSQIPTEIAKELATQSAYWADHNRPLLLDYASEERRRGERIVFEIAIRYAHYPDRHFDAHTN